MNKQILTEILESKDNSVFFFKADWCGHCKEVFPTIKKYCTKNSLPLHEINDDEEINSVFKVEFYPTLIILNEGKLLKYVGNQKINEFISNGKNII
jgi:thiol-disulfide isomerase/thioredoxin